MGCFHSKQTGEKEMEEEAKKSNDRRSPHSAVVTAAPAVLAASSPLDNNDTATTANTETNEHESIMDSGDKGKEVTTTLPMNCLICCSDIPESLQATVSRPCKYHSSPTCDSCMRELFLNACKDESRMPPICCKPIPVSYGRRVLSAEEMALFQAKYEEYNTPNRLYCPVPTCSAFIPPRLFPKEKQLQQQKSRKARERKEDGEGEGSERQQLVTVSPPSVPTPPPTPPDEASTSVLCPQCSARVCVACKQLSHPGDPCTEGSDIPPELEALLKTWGIKRCPRCRAAVRRMYGCKHIRCRCGAQWCWWCTGPYRDCANTTCEAEAEGEQMESRMDAEADEYYEQLDNHDGSSQQDDAPNHNAVEEDGNSGNSHQENQNEQQTSQHVNLDAGNIWEGYDYDFGSEPDMDEINPLLCNHSWTERYASSDETTQTQEEDACANCWRPLVPRPDDYLYIGLQHFLETGTLKDMPPEEFPNPEDFSNICEDCGIILCHGCKELEQAQQSKQWR